eukprot:gnl/MRDRNA2_/MRDRNA2_79750_c0_seq1.p1 gnl/MRDRNA2_/MRDRNA2_79750_c0~~gnl/MRDRNA2_/MRDRNA2_79750_c0_seq1.p1  ORF type:complete len:686 (-),score=132.70 gnl/MRDRNA2_/MRDRNA2_79750_c0_seq1:12-1814(-)
MDQACLESSERWIMEENGLFFPTYFNETSVRRSASGKRSAVNSQWLVKGVESMSIAFSHDFRVERPDGRIEKGSSKPVNDDEQGTLTILQGSDGTEVTRWEPGESPTLKLKTILGLSGVSLDSISQAVGNNYAVDAQISDGALARLSGLEVVIALSYKNANYHEFDWAGPVCIVTIRAAEKWTFKSESQVLDVLGSTRFRHYHGLRVRITTSGSFGWIEPQVVLMNLINIVTSAVVFVGVAQKIVYLVAIHLLGQLSKVYRQFVIQKVSLGQECEGLAARLATYSETYKSIKDQHHGITERRLFARLLKIFKDNDEIDNREIMRLVKFIFNTLDLNPEGAEEEGGPTLGLSEYVRACSLNEDLTFDSMAALLDDDRKKTFLEHAFRDDSVHRLFQSEDVVPHHFLTQNSGYISSKSDYQSESKKPVAPAEAQVAVQLSRAPSLPPTATRRPLADVLKEADEYCSTLDESKIHQIVEEDDTSQMQEVKTELKDISSQWEAMLMEFGKVVKEQEIIKNRLHSNAAQDPEVSQRSNESAPADELNRNEVEATEFQEGQDDYVQELPGVESVVETPVSPRKPTACLDCYRLRSEHAGSPQSWHV